MTLTKRLKQQLESGECLAPLLFCYIYFFCLLIFFLKNLFQDPNGVNLDDYQDPRLISGMLILFLRSMSPPLVPFEVYDFLVSLPGDFFFFLSLASACIWIQCTNTYRSKSSENK